MATEQAPGLKIPREELLPFGEQLRLPTHIAIIAEDNPAMLEDPRFVPATQRLVEKIAALGTQVLTINFPKPEDEAHIDNLVKEMNFDAIKPRDDVPSLFRAHVNELTVILKFGFDGRGEIVRAAKRAIHNGETDMNEEIFKRYRDMPEIPDADVVYYTGESNPTVIQFRNTDVWGEAYSEYFPSGVPFLEQTDAPIDKLLPDYLKRDRRFGGLSNSSNGTDSE